MRLYILALLIIFLSTISAVADAQVAPDHMIISGKDWMVANGMDTSTITVTVYDTAGNPLPLVSVTLQGTPPWTLSATSGVTDPFGQITTVLQPTTRSGSDPITVNASVIEAGVLKSIEQVYLQNIDHSIPQTAVPTYDVNVSIGGTTSLQVKVTDAYGNPVDNRNMVETVQFTTSGSTGSGFWDGTSYVKILTAPVDSGGIAHATFLVAQSGANFVNIQPPSPIPSRLITITGINDGSPYAITQAVSPGGYPYPYTSTDGSKFRVLYTLLDQFGNPSGNRGVVITTSVPGEQMTLTTNSYGIVAFYYQKDIAGLYTLTATAVDNSSVTASQTVEFVAANPTTMLLTASPQTMPSRDVVASTTSTLFAKVIDDMGNPVKGEVVSFTVWSYKVGIYDQTVNPSIENETTVTDIPRTVLTATTDTDGLAHVTFRPGAFTTNRSDSKYSYTAQGTALIQATWGSVTQTIELQYMNYPFLSVGTSVEPKTVVVNNTVNISVQLRGDGWALQPKPLDVVLLWDRSGSMLFNETLDTSKSPDLITSESPDDRLVMAMAAGKLFVDKMNSSDRVGLVSFGDLSGTSGWAVLYHTGNSTSDSHLYSLGWRAGRDYTLDKYGNGQQYSTDDATYVTSRYPGHGAWGKYYGSAMATTDLNLSYDKSTVKNIVSNMVPNGGTPLRQGLYQAVRQIISDPDILAHRRDNAIRAIVLLTDGAWNTGGDPRGGSGAVSLPGINTGSVITLAAQNNISIYTIALGSEPYKDQLASYANQTGGKAYIANSGLDLDSIYASIAGELHTQAGVGTAMDLSFHTIDVNGAMIPGIDVLKYVPKNPYSTHEFSYNATMPVIVNRWYDQTTDWDTDQNLSFNVGTIFIGGVWEANFSMKVLKQGNIKILDSNSSIRFNDGSSLPIPDTYITSLPNSTGIGLEGIGIRVTDVRRTDTGTNPDYVDVAWNLAYTGLEPFIQEYVDIRQEGTLEWNRRMAKTVDPFTTSDALTLSISSLPAGIWEVRVTAHADDAGDDAMSTQFAIVKAEGTSKIKIT
ncbi:MAG TPA: Ig-like domain-containing protein [Methanomicrobiales archaeon]|nr:Ig-like domain-containing protein [Methanomicrobiales archaeon]